MILYPDFTEHHITLHFTTTLRCITFGMWQSFTYIASNSLLFHECFLCSGFTKHEIKLRCIKLHYITFQNFSSLMVLYPGFTEYHITLHAITFQFITFTYITLHFITFLPEWFYILPLLNISVGCFQGNKFRSYKMSFLYYTEKVKSGRVPFLSQKIIHFDKGGWEIAWPNSSSPRTVVQI